MTVDFAKLKSMGKDELLALAKQVNAPHHFNNAPETLVESIINKVMENINEQAKQKPASDTKAVKEAVFLTEDAVEAAIAKVKKQTGAFSSSYDDEAKCVTFRYNDGRYKHAETISLSSTLSRIIRKAQEVARGPIVLRTHNQEDWGSLGQSNGKNAYTNVVLG